MDTNQLIDSLTTELKPVRRLKPATWRLALWFAVALPVVAVIVAIAGLRPDIAAQLRDAGFRVQEMAAVLTAIVAGWAALAAGVPGTERWKLWLPTIPLLFWMTTLGEQCWHEWIRATASGWTFQPEFECFSSIALVGIVPAGIVFVMIRRGAPFRPSFAIMWGTLAAAALANAAHLLFHPADAALMGIVSQLMSVPLFLGLAALAKHKLIPSSFSVR